MSSTEKDDYPFKNPVSWENEGPPIEFTSDHLRELLGPMKIELGFSKEYGDGFVGYMDEATRKVVNNNFLAIHFFNAVHNRFLNRMLPKTLPTVEVNHGYWKNENGIFLAHSTPGRQTIERVEQIQLVTEKVENGEIIEWLMFKGTSGRQEVTLYIRQDRKIVYSYQPGSPDIKIPDVIAEVEQLKMVGAEGLEPPTLSV